VVRESVAGAMEAVVMVLLWHLDGKLPNLALMRLAAHHRERGDVVELRQVSNGSALDVKAWREIEPRFDDPPWDRVYASAIFERTRPLAERLAALYPGAEIGGTGTWSLGRTLADVGISEDGPLDYSSYPDFTASLGFTAMGGGLMLPTPRLTAIIDDRGNVTILGEEIAKPGGGVTGRTNARCHCHACGQSGHISTNRRCPARSKG
jgi:hypothetical protein